MGNKRVEKVETVEPVEIVNLEKPSKCHKRERQSDNEVTDNQDEIFVGTNSKPKKKNKSTDADPGILISESVPKDIVRNGVVKNEQLKEEALKMNIEDLKIETLEFPPEVNHQPLLKEFKMPQYDVLELIHRIEILLPDNDCLSYKCRADKIRWNEIAFSHYSAKDCKDTWFNLQKSIRRYRILKEVLDDAKSFVVNPPKSKKNVYPEMPPKPPTIYQLFYKEKKPTLSSEKPGLDIAEISKQISQMFKNLSPEKKKKYERQATQLKVQYEEELQLFYENHPDLAESIKKDKLAEDKPSKPSNPFMLYFKNQCRKNRNADNHNVNSDNLFKEQCKKQWKQLAMKNKILWITEAEQDVARYEEEMKENILKHPNYNHIPIKSILNKEEIALKERYSGKPDKPPTTAYSLFSKNLLQSDEIKKINAKDRMNHIGTQWKNCTEDERNKYKARVHELIQQYKKDYEKYLESLPEGKKQLEIQKNAPKKKSKAENAHKGKKAKGETEKVSEPAIPPISPFRYFASSKNIEDRKVAKKEWKELSDDEKKEYEKKLVEIKRGYILQFDKFLNTQSKEEFEEFTKTKQELKFNSEDSADDDDTTSSSSDDDNTTSSSSDDEDYSDEV